MRQCLLNDCTGFVGIAPCCLDCSERDVCPDSCPKTDNIYCVGVIEDYNDKNTSRALQEKPAVR